jgi:hypothetical protein
VHPSPAPATFVWLLSAACLIPTLLSLRTPAQVSATAPPRWVGARFDDGRIGVSVADTGKTPRAIVTESDPHRSRDSLTVTDVAFDVRREMVYLGTCCEPGSGQLPRVDLRASSPALTFDDQGFAVDVGGATSTLARADTFGTLAVRASPHSRQEIRAQVGASDVAVDGTARARAIALIQSKRLRALVPTVSQHEPGILVLQMDAGGRWIETRYPIPGNTTYCGIVALANGSIGLLAGQLDSARPLACVGDRLDIYDTANQELRAGAVKFPHKVRHLSVDDSSTFLIFTTVDGAVRWQTLAGDGGSLAPRGFVAADW